MTDIPYIATITPPEFRAFPKLARFNRDVIITEKLDGTNAQVLIKELDPALDYGQFLLGSGTLYPGMTFGMFAGSRSRMLTEQEDNYGFAKWVSRNSKELWALGEGRHFGEWWGNGIQRGYGLPGGDKRFSLFNTTRWQDDAERPGCVDIVPVLYEGPLFMNAGQMGHEPANQFWIRRLQFSGSQAVPGYKNPEGIVIFHTHSNTAFKVSLDAAEDAGGKTR